MICCVNVSWEPPDAVLLHRKRGRASFRGAGHKPLPDKEVRAFGEVLARRRQIVGMLTAERNRLGTATSEPVKKRIEAHVRWLERELERIEGDLDEAIKGSRAWRESEALLRSVPGVGPVLARTLLAELPSWAHSTENAWPPWLASLP